jgi:hypothetical protein
VITLKDPYHNNALGIAESNKFLSGGEYITLGSDAELVPTVNGAEVWPHLVDCPQQRVMHSELWYHTYGDVHGDGFAFEICTLPTVCIDELMLGAKTALVLARDGIMAKLKLPREMRNTFGLKMPTLYEVPRDVVETAPPEVRALGCAPSFNVYKDPGMPSLLGRTTRTTGCHFHASSFNYDNPLKGDTAELMVRWCDVLAGTVWTAINPDDPKAEAFRRQAYGRAGEHRKNTYPSLYSGYSDTFGVEYRALPGRVLSHTAYFSMMAALTRGAALLASWREEPTEDMTDAARKIINNSDKEGAIEFVRALPWSDQSRNLINWYIENPLRVLTVDEWEENAIYHWGFRVMHATLTMPTYRDQSNVANLRNQLL